MAKNASFIHHFEAGFKLFHELMSKRVREILLVSSPYDAFIMEEDGFLGEKTHLSVLTAWPKPRSP